MHTSIRRRIHLVIEEMRRIESYRLDDAHINFFLRIPDAFRAPIREYRATYGSANSIAIGGCVCNTQ